MTAAGESFRTVSGIPRIMVFLFQNVIMHN